MSRVHPFQYSQIWKSRNQSSRYFPPPQSRWINWPTFYGATRVTASSGDSICFLMRVECTEKWIVLFDSSSLNWRNVIGKRRNALIDIADLLELIRRLAVSASQRQSGPVQNAAQWLSLVLHAFLLCLSRPRTSPGTCISIIVSAPLVAARSNYHVTISFGTEGCVSIARYKCVPRWVGGLSSLCVFGGPHFPFFWRLSNF